MDLFRSLIFAHLLHLFVFGAYIYNGKSAELLDSKNQNERGNQSQPSNVQSFENSRESSEYNEDGEIGLRNNVRNFWDEAENFGADEMKWAKSKVEPIVSMLSQEADSQEQAIKDDVVVAENVIHSEEQKVKKDVKEVAESEEHKLESGLASASNVIDDDVVAAKNIIVSEEQHVVEDVREVVKSDEQKLKSGLASASSDVKSEEQKIEDDVDAAKNGIVSEEQHVEQDVMEVAKSDEQKLESGLAKASIVVESQEQKIEDDMAAAKNVIVSEEQQVEEDVSEVVTSGEQKVKSAVNVVENKFESTYDSIGNWMTSTWDAICDSFHTILRVLEVVGFFVFLGIFLKLYLKARELEGCFADIFSKHAAQHSGPTGNHPNLNADTRV